MKHSSWSTVFFRNESRLTFNSLSDYYETIESQLESIKEKDRTRISKDIRKLGLNDDEAYVEWDVSLQEHAAKYDMFFTNFSRYSFVVLSVLALEDWLYRLCVAIHDKKPETPNPPIPQGNIVNKYKEYMNRANVKISDKLWDRIKELYTIRNCIVHTSGNVERRNDKEKEKIKSICLNNTGIRISNYQNRDRHEPLYLENGMLIIEPEYCRQMLKDMKLLFEELCEAANIPEIDLKDFFKSLGDTKPKPS